MKRLGKLRAWLKNPATGRGLRIVLIGLGAEMLKQTLQDYEQRLATLEAVQAVHYDIERLEEARRAAGERPRSPEA